jgi:uncharacterized protein YjlB
LRARLARVCDVRHNRTEIPRPPLDGYDAALVRAQLTTGSATREQALAAFRDDGCGQSRSWGNGPGDRYARHRHDEHKVLFCLGGSIVFHTHEGDLELAEGDRLDLPAGTTHAATVGPDGCECIEAYRDREATDP